MKTNTILGFENKTNFNKNEMTQTQRVKNSTFKITTMAGRKLWGGIVTPFGGEFVFAGTTLNTVQITGTIRGATPIRASMANASLEMRLYKVPLTKIMKNADNFFLQKDNQSEKPETLPFYTAENSPGYISSGSTGSAAIGQNKDESNLYEYCTISGQFLPTLTTTQNYNQKYHVLDERAYKVICNEEILNKEYQTLYRLDNEDVCTETENNEYDQTFEVRSVDSNDGTTRYIYNCVKTETEVTASDGKIQDGWNNILCRKPKQNNYFTNYRKEAVDNNIELPTTLVEQTQAHQSINYEREKVLNISMPERKEVARIYNTRPAKDDRVELIAEKTITIPYYQQEATDGANLGETGGWIYVDINENLFAGNFVCNQHSIIMLVVSPTTENIPSQGINIWKKKLTVKEFYNKELSNQMEDDGIREIEVHAKSSNDRDADKRYLGYKRKYIEFTTKGNIFFSGSLRDENISTYLARNYSFPISGGGTAIPPVKEENQSNWHFADDYKREDAIGNIIDYSDYLFSRNSVVKNEFPLIETADTRGKMLNTNEHLKPITESSGEPQFIMYAGLNITVNEPIDPEITTQKTDKPGEIK